MWKDPIIESLRETRAKILEEAGGDLAEYVRRLQAMPSADSAGSSKLKKPTPIEKVTVRC